MKHIRGCVAVSLLCSVALSWPVWRDAGRDELPLFPFVGWACGIASLFPLVHVAALLLLAALVVRPSRKVLVAWLAAVTALLLEDQNRLLPWVVQWSMLLMVCCELSSEPTRLRRAALLVCGGVYFWSGFHKLNSTFVDTIFPQLMLPVLGSPGAFGSLVNSVGGYAAPIAELSLGVMLIVPSAKLQLVGAAMGVAMHLFILLSVGPLGSNMYVSIWPWNVGCIVVLLLLRNPAKSSGHDLPLMRRGREKSGRSGRELLLFSLVIAVCWVLPALFFATSCYPAYMSWSMFGGDVKQAMVMARSIEDIENVRALDAFENTQTFDPLLMMRMPDYDQFEWKAHIYLYPLLIVGSPFPPELSLFKSFFALLCREAAQSIGLVLEVQQPAHWIFGSWKPLRFTCADVEVTSC